MPAVLLTEDNLAITTLRRSWATAVYTSDDGIGSMGSLHEAGDALVAVALLDDDGTTILGSGAMIGPGLAVVATHVLDEFRARGAKPILFTLLPEGGRAWLPRESSTVSGPSAYGADRKIVSDISLLSCTLNSEAHEHLPLNLAPLQIALPLIDERLWAFGYRHERLEDSTAVISPLVSSGLVTSVYPNGRGERMPSSCVEVAMDTKGGMSGGPVVNANGDLVGIVSSSIDGGPSYVTLIWEALRMTISSRLPVFEHYRDINLFIARDLGLIKLKGEGTSSKRGNVTVTLTGPESELLAKSSDPAHVTKAPEGSKVFSGEELESFEELWMSEIESVAVKTAMAKLRSLDLPILRSCLGASDVPDLCLAKINDYSVDDFDGLEDPDIDSVRLNEDGTVSIKLAFDLLSVYWTVEVTTSDYLTLADEYQVHFMNIDEGDLTTSMELYQRLHFEATLTLDPGLSEFTEAVIDFAGVISRRRKVPASL